MADGACTARTTFSTVRLGDIADIFDGPHATPPKSADGPIFLGISNLSQGRLDLTSTEHLSEGDFLKWTRRVMPRANDVVFSYETRLGEAALMPHNLRCCLGRRMGLLRPKAGVHPRFLLYAYLGPEFQETIRQRTVHGSTVDRIPLIDMPGFPLLLPPFRDQCAIAVILGALDDKIELNRRMNETLEEMARALFKSWFVDFDPVHAKAAGKKPYGMDAVTAAVFPDTFTSGCGIACPQGWRAGTVREVCREHAGEVRTGPFGTALKAEEYALQGVPVLAVRDILHGYARVSSSTPRVSPQTAERLSVFTLHAGDVVFGRKGAVERFAWVHASQAGWLMGSDCIRLRLPAGSCFDIFLKYLFKTADHRAWMVQHATGTTMASLNQSIVESIPVPPSDIHSRRAFARLVAPFEERSFANRTESETLASLRDTLLPKLLSGELRIQDAEKLVGEAT